ncbi:unnamed protein product, partial [Mesorhabditis spiculigera]
MHDEIWEAFRNPWILVTFAGLLSFCATGSAQVTEAVQVEFKAYRLQQVEVLGTFVGSKTSRISFEGVTLDGNFLRRCIVADWSELVGRDLNTVLGSSAGALLVVVPSDFSNLTAEKLKSFSTLEQYFLNARTELGVYVTPRNENTDRLLEEAASKSATTQSSVTATLISPSTLLSTVGSPSANPLTYQPNNVVARLLSGDRTAPTIAFVAHYDTHSAFPGLGTGTDSNGSGVVALLELLAILKKFYDRTSTRPKYNVAFIWTAAGKSNFQGARQAAESFLSKDAESKLELAICLEGLGGKGPLVMHVAKNPTEGSASERFLKKLGAIEDVKVVSKKINMNQPLSWEHEKFNIKRLASATISRFSGPDVPVRRSLVDSHLDREQLSGAILALTEATLAYLLQIEAPTDIPSHVRAEYKMISKDEVSRERLDFFIEKLAHTQRSVADEVKTKEIAGAIASIAGGYAKVSQQAVVLSESSVWGGIQDTIVAERIRPAAFELFILAGVFAYLAMFSQVTNHILPFMEGAVKKLK